MSARDLAFLSFFTSARCMRSACPVKRWLVCSLAACASRTCLSRGCKAARRSWASCRTGAR
eukprot:5870292-Lingulodinium_polyedra.AAC.1